VDDGVSFFIAFSLIGLGLFLSGLYQYRVSGANPIDIDVCVGAMNY
jgi:hypothetical protein